MKDELVRFLQRIKLSTTLYSLGEAAAKTGIIEPILRLLGWDTSILSDEVKLEYSIGDGRVDYCLQTSKTNLVFLEAKRPSEDLEKIHDTKQLLTYCFSHGVKLAILSNGITWSFYLPLTEGDWEHRRFYMVDIIEKEADEAASRLIDFLSREKVASGEAIRNAEKLLQGKRREEIINDSIPEAWNRIVTEPDASLVELLAEKTNKISGFSSDESKILDFFHRNSDRFLLSPEDEMPEEPKLTIPSVQVSSRVNLPISDSDKVTERDLSKEIIIALQSIGGRAEKEKVEEIIFNKYERIFNLPYYQQSVSWGLPRWKHYIAWAKEDVKKSGYVKWPNESGRGIWELTSSGKTKKF